jgi:hypothetical protein
MNIDGVIRSRSFSFRVHRINQISHFRKSDISLRRKITQRSYYSVTTYYVEHNLRLKVVECSASA